MGLFTRRSTRVRSQNTRLTKADTNVNANANVAIKVNANATCHLTNTMLVHHASSTIHHSSKRGMKTTPTQPKNATKLYCMCSLAERHLLIGCFNQQKLLFHCPHAHGHSSKGTKNVQMWCIKQACGIATRGDRCRSKTTISIHSFLAFQHHVVHQTSIWHRNMWR